MSATVEATAIRRFRIDVPDELVELRSRIAAARWPSEELVADRSQAMRPPTMRALTRYWATEHDWRNCEAKPNVLPQLQDRDRWPRHRLQRRRQGRPLRRPGETRAVVTGAASGIQAAVIEASVAQAVNDNRRLT